MREKNRRPRTTKRSWEIGMPILTGTLTGTRTGTRTEVTLRLLQGP